MKINLSHIWPAFSEVIALRKVTLAQCSADAPSITDSLPFFVTPQIDLSALTARQVTSLLCKLWRWIAANFWSHSLTQTTGLGKQQCGKQANDFLWPWRSLMPLQGHSTQRTTDWWKRGRWKRSNASSCFHKWFDCLVQIRVQSQPTSPTPTDLLFL